MSGLEGLAALGLACSIFQTVSFGRETLALVKEVYQNGSIDHTLVHKSTAIQGVASDIVAVEIPRPLGQYEQKLFDVTKKCTGFARDLKEEIAFLMGHNIKGSLRATLKTAVKVNWRKRRLERMERDLADSEQLMQSSLLVWIFKSINTASVNIDSLEESVRHFVIKYDQGHRQTSELVSEEALRVRETIIREAGKTDMAMRDHVTQTVASVEQKFKDHFSQTSTERRKERLLNSFKYPGLNERANQVEDAHPLTFRWFFADQDDLSPSNDRNYTNDERNNTKVTPEMVWSSFTDWLQSHLGIYWIMGKPGSGKSTLSKFILSQPHTKILLERWRRDVIVASHYFWRPGNIMQRSIKGMLCSIARQLVLAIPDALQYASLNVRSLDQKDADTDWAVPELQRLCLGLVRHSGKPLCLLIDGLDECGPEDGHQELLDILERFQSQDVKIIASSRDEPVFERRFRHQPQLRIQDLTRGDLRTYATTKLHDEIRKDPSFASHLASQAEGVFLWLVLAVQSLNRGCENGESNAELRKRLENLPQRLNDMYRDMCIRDGLSIAEMMLASFEGSHHGFADASAISESHFLEECERFCRRVQVRCAGLLVNTGRSTEPRQGGLGVTRFAILGYANKEAGFQFIHRSAQDFLVDTMEGRDILRHDGTPAEDLDLQILSASVRTAKLLSMMRGSSPLSLNLDNFLSDLSIVAHAREGAVIALLSRYYELYISADLLSDQFDRRYTRPANFFGFVALYSNLNRHAVSIVKDQVLGRSLRSAVLLCALDRREGLPIELTRRLLRLPEVDVNLKCPVLLPRQGALSVVYGSEIGPLDHVESSPFTRLLGIGLETLDWRPLAREQTRASHAKLQFLNLVSEFALRGADFHSTVFLAFRLHTRKDMATLDTREQVWPGGLFQIPGWDSSNQHPFEYGDGSILCVMALQPTTVIQKMLASLLKTDLILDDIDKAEHSSGEDDSDLVNLAKSISVLSQKCQEHECGASDHFVGFLQPFENFADVPYRQLSDEDSASLTNLMLTCIFDGVEVDQVIIRRFREAVVRSPFSNIGFRDYLRGLGCFDNLAAEKLLSEYQEEHRGLFHY
ncbi:hypothetical protein KVR01_011750 [Diaporthe batatas]|uniref:uncharacterized protein n=1 Tax=Diaporthe batatas TaxID=748121 RepID=UPI001D03BC04|nr:uncharacterized protein KVR01_011750 [Diaporthe batatas]KAG8158628.1 hypothetical protein KVR01_011750 [Diaporthe batatas]